MVTAKKQKLKSLKGSIVRRLTKGEHITTISNAGSTIEWQLLKLGKGKSIGYTETTYFINGKTKTEKGRVKYDRGLEIIIGHISNRRISKQTYRKRSPSPIV